MIMPYDAPLFGQIRRSGRQQAPAVTLRFIAKVFQILAEAALKVAVADSNVLPV
jgi:hypothetical protein